MNFSATRTIWGSDFTTNEKHRESFCVLKLYCQVNYRVLVKFLPENSHIVIEPQPELVYKLFLNFGKFVALIKLFL